MTVEQLRPDLNRRSPLSILCVGTGRDGTTSLAQMIQNAFDREGRGRTVMHEWMAMAFYGEFCNYKESGDPAHLENIRRFIAKCPYDCIVGNGYAPVLDLFREICGEQLTVIHLQRGNRAACVTSLARNAELFPVNHRYYAPSPPATGKRMAAFHFDEMTREAWDGCTLQQRFEWYYDKTHALMEEGSKNFVSTATVRTEALGAAETLQTLGRLAGVSFPLTAVYVNRHVELDSIEGLEDRAWIQRLLGKLDLARLSADPSYGIGHFLREFHLQLESRIARCGPADQETLTEIRQVLEQARHELISGLDATGELYDRISEPASRSVKRLA